MDNPLNLIIEDSLAEVYVVDIETRKYVYANKTAQRNLGYTLEELKASTPEMVSPHFTLEDFRELLEPGWNKPGHPPIVLQNTHRRKDGTEYPVDAHVQYTTYAGRPAFVGLVFDATPRQKELDQLRSVIKGGELGYWDLDVSPRESFVDDKWLEMIGRERGEIDESNPEDWRRFIHPEDREKLFAAVNAAVRAQRTYTLEFRMLHKEGHVVWIQSCGSVVEWNHRENRAARICGTHLDITERKLNEKEKEQFLLFFDIAPDIMTIVDTEGRLLKVNPSAERILGYSQDELLGRPFIDFIYEPDRQPTIDAITRHLQDGRTMDFQNRYVCKDGSLRWLSWNSIHDPKAGLSFATGRDITEQQEIAEKLRGQEVINRALVENSEDLVVLYDRDHNYLYVNPALERTLGIPREEFIGSNRENFAFPPELRKLWYDTVERVFRSGIPESRVYEIDTPTGRLKLSWNAFPGIRNKEGEIESVFGVSRNVTEYVRAEEEAQKIERLESLGVLAGGIAHDFNNILTILFGNIAAAKSQLHNPEEARHSLENAEKAFQRSSFLTNQLLTFAKGGEPRIEELDLARLVRETITFDLSDSKTKLQMHCADDLWMARVDNGQIAQVFSNLAINANQAMPQGGRLFVSLENRELSGDEIQGVSAGRYILARVRDEGVGIQSGELPRIFDPYYSTKQAGSGLGLATVHSIIMRHRGYITVDSTPGLGTTFEILLPAAMANPLRESREPRDIVREEDRDYRVLVMDDEDMICELAQSILGREGYLVDTASDGDEAIARVGEALARNAPYDCIIMDLTIPGGMGGKDAVVKVLELDPEAKVIVSSGYAVDPVMANFEEYGFRGMITKPFTIKTLSEEVRRLSRGASAA